MLGRIGGVSHSDKVWMTIIDRPLFPIMSYGCHLWDLNRCGLTRMIKSGLRKALRRFLKMTRFESISDRLGDKFQEATERKKTQFHEESLLLCKWGSKRHGSISAR